MTERQTFLAQLERAKADGLVDLKFLFMPKQAMGAEEIYKAMNEVEAAIQHGRDKIHAEWRGNKPA